VLSEVVHASLLTKCRYEARQCPKVMVAKDLVLPSDVNVDADVNTVSEV
jgi:hypothetical protein